MMISCVNLPSLAPHLLHHCHRPSGPTMIGTATKTTNMLIPRVIPSTSTVMIRPSLNVKCMMGADIAQVLHKAVRARNRELVRRTLREKEHYKDGLTPLSAVAYEGDVLAVRFLLRDLDFNQNNALLNQPNKDRSYPVHKACLAKLQAVEVLQEFYSADPNSVLKRDGNGRTVLHLAEKHKKRDVISYLLSLPQGKQHKMMDDENEKYTSVK